MDSEGGVEDAAPQSHTYTHTQFHTPDLNFHKDSLISALWPPLVLRGFGIPDNSSVDTSMCSKVAPEVR